jgi:hypothetical protein
MADVLLQTLSTHGMGGVGGNARGVKQYKGEIVAVVNNGSNSVALYQRRGKDLRLDKLVTTTSAPVSVDLGNDHMYVAGATTVDSFVIARGAGQSHLSLFTYNKFGELTASGAPITLGVPGANGVAIMAPADRDEY